MASRDGSSLTQLHVIKCGNISDQQSFINEFQRVIKNREQNVNNLKQSVSNNLSAHPEVLNRISQFCSEICDRPITIAITGRVSCGKSMLASALVDNELKLPSQDGLTTVRTTKLVYSSSQKIRELKLELNDSFDQSEIKEFKIHNLALDDFINFGRQHRCDRIYYDKIVEIGTNSDLLKSGLQIFDFPPQNENNLVTSTVLNQMTVIRPSIICYVFDGNQGFNLIDVQNLKRIHQSLEPNVQQLVHYILVANKMDGEDDNELDSSDISKTTFDVHAAEQSVRHSWISMTKRDPLNYLDVDDLMPVVPLSTGLLLFENSDDDCSGQHNLSSLMFKELKKQILDSLAGQSQRICQIFARFIEESDDVTDSSLIDMWFVLQSISVDPHFVTLLQNTLNKHSSDILDFCYGYKLMPLKYLEQHYLITVLSENEGICMQDEKLKHWKKEKAKRATNCPKVCLLANSDNTLCWIDKNVPKQRLIDCLSNISLDYIEKVFHSLALKFQSLDPLPNNFRPDTIYVEDELPIYNHDKIPNDFRLPLLLYNGIKTEALHIHKSRRDSFPSNDKNFTRNKAGEFIFSFGWAMWILLGGPVDENIDENHFNNFPSYLRDVIKLCWSVDPDNVQQVIWFRVCELLGVKNQLAVATQHGNLEKMSFALSNGENVDQTFSSGFCSLHIAASEGYLDCLNLLLDNKADVNACNKDGASALYLAAEKGHIECLKLLLSYGGDPNKAMKNGATPLYIAAEMGNTKCVSFLIQNKVNLNSSLNSGETSLSIASERGHTECVRLLIQNGATIDSVCKRGITPLFAATQEGHFDIVKILLSHGANVGIRRDTGANSLHIASQKGQGECLELLLESNLDLKDSQDNEGRTALLIAAQEGHAQCVEVLLRLGANVDQICKTGETALYIASQEGHSECLKLLLDNHADVNIVAEKRCRTSPVCIAAQEGRLECLKLLLESGADPDIPRSEEGDGVTALYISAQNGHIDCLDILLQYTQNIDCITLEHGFTPLMAAMMNEHADCTQLLLRKGANPNHISQMGWTPLHLAVQMGGVEMVTILLAHAVDINWIDQDGKTALEVARDNEHEAIISILEMSNGSEVL